MNIAILLGAGKGKRVGSEKNKVLLNLLDKPLIFHTIDIFEKSDLIDYIILVVNKINEGEIKNIISKFRFKKVKKIVYGGKKRQDSVYNGVKSLDRCNDGDIILIHNSANPFLSQSTIKKAIEGAKIYGASVAAIPSVDTIKEVDVNNFVIKTLDRSKLLRAQTPQAFRYDLLINSLKQAHKDRFYATDDAALVERLGHRVKIVETEADNLKITTQQDLIIAEAIMNNKSNVLDTKSFRVGFGQDSHRFSNKKKKLVLGGYLLPNETGLEGNSDADVLLHALFNALSSGIGERSLGYYSDSMCKKGIMNSKEYLKLILNKMKEKNFRINNICVSIEAAKPRFEVHTNKIKDSLSKILNIEKNDIGVTYTSGDGLTKFGQGKGIQCFVVVSLVK